MSNKTSKLALVFGLLHYFHEQVSRTNEEKKSTAYYERLSLKNVKKRQYIVF